MGNIIDYVREYGQYTFSQEPFNEVDNLVLCQLIYLDYEKYVPGLEKRNIPVSIQSIYQDPAWTEILDNYWFREDNKALFEEVVQSVRFGTLKMNYYVNVIDEEQETQFSAMTYVLEDKNCYIAYRGTDATLIGWKEDCNLAFSKPLNSHRLSAEYMNRVAGYIGGNFFAGGHSKGGNLAVYAAMNCSEHVRNKLLGVYNNDGPGFRPEILEEGNYEGIEGKTFKFIPRSSIVGVILQSETDYEVVESKSFGVFQHNAYNWKIEDKAFVRAGNRDDFTTFRDAALNEWILALPDEEKHAFIDTLYNVVAASEVKDLFQLGANWKSCFQSMSGALRGIDDETRKALQKIIRSGFDIASGMAVVEIKERQQEAKQRQQEIRQSFIDWTQDLWRKKK